MEMLRADLINNKKSLTCAEGDRKPQITKQLRAHPKMRTHPKMRSRIRIKIGSLVTPVPPTLVVQKTVANMMTYTAMITMNVQLTIDHHKGNGICVLHTSQISGGVVTLFPPSCWSVIVSFNLIVFVSNKNLENCN